MLGENLNRSTLTGFLVRTCLEDLLLETGLYGNLVEMLFKNTPNGYLNTLYYMWHVSAITPIIFKSMYLRNQSLLIEMVTAQSWNRPLSTHKTRQN